MERFASYQEPMKCENPFNSHTLIYRQKVDLFAEWQAKSWHRQILAIQVATNESALQDLIPDGKICLLSGTYEVWKPIQFPYNDISLCRKYIDSLSDKPNLGIG